MEMDVKSGCRQDKGELAGRAGAAVCEAILAALVPACLFLFP
jgi:hypothetical protein